MRAIDPLYGAVTSGNFGWLVAVKDGASVAGGSGFYNSGAGQWQASATLGSDLAGGTYEAVYSITSDRNRQGWAAATLSVAGAGVTVNGTVRDASTEWPLSGAQVAIFPAGGAAGLWTVVNSQYGGVVPALTTLLGQLTPVKAPVTTGADGAFSWADVPVGNSYVIVVAGSGYAQKWSDSFNLSAAGQAVTRKFGLNPTATTLAGLASDVSAIRSAAQEILDYNAQTAGTLSERYFADDLMSYDPGWFNKAASFIGTLGGALSSLDGITTVLAKLGASILAGLLIDQDELLRLTVQNQLFPANASAYKDWTIHTTYQNLLNDECAAFDQVAGGISLGSGFAVSRANDLRKQTESQMEKVVSGGGTYVASPLVTQPVRGFTLTNMARTYFQMSGALEFASGTETALSVVQGGAGVVGIYSGVAILCGGVRLPFAGGAVVVNTAAGGLKSFVAGGKVALKGLMVAHYNTAIIGTYPADDEAAYFTLADYMRFLEAEAASPFYLAATNQFWASAEIVFPKRTLRDDVVWAMGGLAGAQVAEKTAAVTVTDQSSVNSGGPNVSLRCLSYCLWAPVTHVSLVGSAPNWIQTSSDVRGPVSVPPGGQARFEVPYRGHTKELLSYLAPHVLVVESYVGPWRAGTAYKPFIVLGPGEWVPKGSSSTPLRLTSSEVVAPASAGHGRLGAKELELGAKDLTPVAVESLSASNTAVVGTFAAGTNLWAIDFQLYAPAEAGVSLLVTDGKGQRLGYCSTNGITYSELTGLVTDQGQRPISLRVFNPPAGEIYNATVALLTPGPQPVPVSLFAEPKEVSGAVMVCMPSRVILDGSLGTQQSVDVSIAEASQQQALTNVSGTLSNLVKCGGTAALPVLTNALQSMPNIGAGESGGVSWPVEISTAAERGKYVGTVRLSCAQTADLDVPVVAVVRRATEVLSLFEGTDATNGVLQTSVTNHDGSGQTWVHVPKGFFVVHGQFAVAGGSTNLLNPTIDIGADGSVEWAFSGVFDLGVVVDNVETAFNNYLLAHSSASNTIPVPIRLTGNAGESMQFGSLQLYLETIPNELRAIEVLPDGSARFELLGQPGYSYRVEASSDLVTWQSLGSVTATNAVMPFTDATAPGYAARFYRAVLE